MENVRIRDLRDSLALHVNTAINEGNCVGITRDGRQVAAVVPYNYALLCERLRAVSGISDLLSCLRDARDAFGNPLIQSFIINTLEKGLLGLSTHKEHRLLIDMNSEVDSHSGRTTAIKFSDGQLSGHVSVIEIGGRSKIMAILLGMPPDKSAALIMSNGDIIDFNKEIDGQMVINGKDINNETDLELTRIYIK